MQWELMFYGRIHLLWFVCLFIYLIYLWSIARDMSRKLILRYKIERPVYPLYFKRLNRYTAEFLSNFCETCAREEQRFIAKHWEEINNHSRVRDSWTLLKKKPRNAVVVGIRFKRDALFEFREESNVVGAGNKVFCVLEMSKISRMQNYGGDGGIGC